MWNDICFGLRKLFYRKPQSLGEGMKRIVNSAGKSKNASIVYSIPGERIYSNGVNIYSTDLLNQSYSVFGRRKDYATYVLTQPWKKGISEDTIFAVKGKTVTDNCSSIDKVIGDKETYLVTYNNGAKHIIKNKNKSENTVKSIFLDAFM